MMQPQSTPAVGTSARVFVSFAVALLLVTMASVAFFRNGSSGSDRTAQGTDLSWQPYTQLATLGEFGDDSEAALPTELAIAAKYTIKALRKLRECKDGYNVKYGIAGLGCFHNYAEPNSWTKPTYAKLEDAQAKCSEYDYCVAVTKFP